MAQTPISLTYHISRNRKLKAKPPQSLVLQGIACFPPSTMQALKLHVLDTVMLASKSHRAIVTAWPLAAIPPAHIAFDDNTLDSLHLVPVKPDTKAMGTPVKKKKPKRKSGGVKSPYNAGAEGRTRNGRGRERDRENDPYSQQGRGRERRRDVEPEKGGNFDLDQGNFVTLERVLEVETAEPVRVVNLRPIADVPLECLRADEYVNMVQVELRRRLLVQGMRVLFSFLGEYVAFEVVRMDGMEGEVGKCDNGTMVNFIGVQEKEEENKQSGLRECIGGLDAQLSELLMLTRAAFSEEDDDVDNSNAGIHGSWRHKPRGALLYGPPGTGKTMLACAVAEELGVNAEVVCGPEMIGEYSGEAIGKVGDCFARARRRRPCVVVLDEVDAMTPKREAVDTDNVQRKLTAALLAIMDGGVGTGLEGIFVIGTTSRLESVDGAMRRAGRFDREIEVGVPDAKGRGEILERLCEKARRDGKIAASVEEVLEVGRVCYGYVGADLTALWREAVGMAIRDEREKAEVGDMRKAMGVVKPSGLREVSVQIAKTRWSDIGGKVEAKRRLREAIEWPLSRQGMKLFKEVGVKPPRGLLLFGPPGCSKTLLARAVASESGANFISVKGAELLSKWVGESEKAVRGIFRKARQAGPCVVFFDEVDALAGKRGGMSGSGAQARVVAQLLAEMDGIERYDNEDGGGRVIVVAATNRPDCLDEAFLRAGRIDMQIYVGLPDCEERVEILLVHTRGMPVDEDVELEKLAERLEGYSGAEVGAVVREAGLSAMERGGRDVERVIASDFEQAIRMVTKRTPASMLRFFDDYIKKVNGQSRGLMQMS